ncbi:MAG: DHH family phosphoesterase, partial [Methanomassiliicoccales archaeon]|nr:DHH family phosphoesterase [Methanomassiliicoccales archaeon]
VSAAIFLNRFPDAKVTFVTSPTAGAKVLSLDSNSDEIFLVDLAPVPDLVEAVRTHRSNQELTLVDHHPSSLSVECRTLVMEGVSAANVLFHHLRPYEGLRKLVAVADLVEYMPTPLLDQEMRRYGRQRMDQESMVLDFSWRLIIDDDRFRYNAAKMLSRGLWPTQVDAVNRRYVQVVNEKRWPRALARVESNLKVRGPLGVMDDMNRNRTLYGFGTRALVEVAFRRGCDYAVMINPRGKYSSVSVRGISADTVDLGRFVEDFTKENGVDGGGHPKAAGARIPTGSNELFLTHLLENVG